MWKRVLGAKQINKATLSGMSNPTSTSDTATGSMPQTQTTILSFGGVLLDKLRVPDPNDPKYWRESFDVKSYRDDFAAWRQEVIRIYNNLKIYLQPTTEQKCIADEIASLLGKILGLE